MVGVGSVAMLNNHLAGHAAYGAVNATSNVARSYDNRNRLLTVSYPGGGDLNITQTWLFPVWAI